MTNIKSLLLGILLFTLVTAIYGQTNKFEIGIEGSPSLIFLRGNVVIDDLHKPTIGFSGGLFFQYNFMKVLSLRTNIAYERKGSSYTYQETDIYGNNLQMVTGSSNFDYLTLPILVRLTFGQKVQYFVNAGPYIGYLIKQNNNNPTTSIDNTTFYKSFDAGISTGIGLSFPIKKQFSFSMELRNNLGLYNVSAVFVNNNESIKTNSTNLLFGFIYKL